MRRSSPRLMIIARNWHTGEMTCRTWSILKSWINPNYCSTSNVGTSATSFSLTVVHPKLYRSYSCHNQSLCLHQWSLQWSSPTRVPGLCLPLILLVQNTSSSYLRIGCFLPLAALLKFEEPVYCNQWRVRGRQNLEYKILFKHTSELYEWL